MGHQSGDNRLLVQFYKESSHVKNGSWTYPLSKLPEVICYNFLNTSGVCLFTDGTSLRKLRDRLFKDFTNSKAAAEKCFWKHVSLVGTETCFPGTLRVSPIAWGLRSSCAFCGQSAPLLWTGIECWYADGEWFIPSAFLNALFSSVDTQRPWLLQEAQVFWTSVLTLAFHRKSGI